jgi:hypothetical protein
MMNNTRRSTRATKRAEDGQIDETGEYNNRTENQTDEDPGPSTAVVPVIRERVIGQTSNIVAQVGLDGPVLVDHFKVIEVFDWIV